MADPVAAPATIESRALAPVERLFDALTDPSRRARTAAVLLTAFTAVWTLYFVLAHGGADVNWDVNEGILWSQDALVRTSSAAHGLGLRSLVQRVSPRRLGERSAGRGLRRDHALDFMALAVGLA